MNPASTDLVTDYGTALHDYLAGAEEAALVHAYEIGRRAIERGLGLLEMVTMHEAALVEEIRGADAETAGRSVQASMAFFSEGLAPFEMAQLGYRAATEAANRAREEAERANQAKSEFLSRVSHELRTPFNAVLGFAQILEMDDLSEDQRESVEQIIRAGKHLLDLINEVLDLSRIESGTLSLSVEPVDLRLVAGEALDLVRGVAHRGGVELRRDLVGPLEIFVAADRQRLKQVLVNLLGNAVKYNREAGTATLSCRSGPTSVRIEVSDEGSGIPMDQIDKLFNPFERLGAEQGDVEGTGLGLAVSKRLVEAMGGAIGIASTSETGTTFFVELALAASPATAFDRSSPRDPGSPEEATRTVLYVEDNASNVALVERILAHRPDVRLLTALNGRQGLELATGERPSLILLDLDLPDLSGQDVLRTLKQDPRTAGIPVVVITAHAVAGRSKELLAAGASDYLAKPVDVAAFLQAVDRALGSG